MYGFGYYLLLAFFVLVFRIADVISFVRFYCIEIRIVVLALFISHPLLVPFSQ